MAFYIFVCNDIHKSDGIVKAIEIIDKLTEYGAWFCTANAPNKNKLVQGDKVLFYACGAGYRCFVVEATIAAPLQAVTKDDLEVMETLGVAFMTYRIPINQISKFPPISMKELVPSLNFIKEKKNWGLHLRLPIVRIEEEDFKKIVTWKIVNK